MDSSHHAEYYPVSLDELGGWLKFQAFQDINLIFRGRPVKEWVFERRYAPHHFVRVYTGINKYGPDKNQSRKVGKDAIRVQAVYRKDGVETLVNNQKRVHRVKGWKDNLKSRIKEILRTQPTVVLDSKGVPMVLRTNKYDGSKFWGSRDYPRNRETKPFAAEEVKTKCEVCSAFISTEGMSKDSFFIQNLPHEKYEDWKLIQEGVNDTVKRYVHEKQPSSSAVNYYIGKDEQSVCLCNSCLKEIRHEWLVVGKNSEFAADFLITPEPEDIEVDWEEDWEEDDEIDWPVDWSAEESEEHPHGPLYCDVCERHYGRLVKIKPKVTDTEPRPPVYTQCLCGRKERARKMEEGTDFGKKLKKLREEDKLSTNYYDDEYPTTYEEYPYEKPTGIIGRERREEHWPPTSQMNWYDELGEQMTFWKVPAWHSACSQCGRKTSKGGILQVDKVNGDERWFVCDDCINESQLLWWAITGANPNDKKNPLLKGLLAEEVELSKYDTTSPIDHMNIDESIAYMIRGTSKTNEYGEIGCPHCESVDLFEAKILNKGKGYFCWWCGYEKKFETIKSRGDITLEKFGLTIECPNCEEEIKVYNHAAFLRHLKKCKEE